jgi:hypothetical protein
MASTDRKNLFCFFVDRPVDDSKQEGHSSVIATHKENAMIYTTLNRIKEHGPCIEGWRKLLKHLGKTGADDEPLALSVILESNGLDDALWCLRSVPEESKRWRLLAVAFARKVQHLMTDPRSLAALDVAERHASGIATDKELAAARAAAGDAAGDAAWAAAWDAAWAAARDDQKQLFLSAVTANEVKA